MGKSIGSGNTLTYTEIHAAILGLVLGVLVGYAYGLGHTEAAVGTAVLFVGIALGVRKRGRLTKAQQTIRYEPWYALAAFVVGAAITTVV